MRPSRVQISLFLIAVITFGACITPLLHAAYHYEIRHYGAHHHGVHHQASDHDRDSIEHEHLDHVAWPDAIHHAADEHLDCSFCSSLFSNLAVLSATSFYKTERTQLLSLAFRLVFESLTNLQNIRGPPAQVD